MFWYGTTKIVLIVLFARCFRCGYENMFITGDDRFQLWVDGTPIKRLKFWDYWPYPDSVEMRSDVGLIAVRIERNVKAGTLHALMSWSNSGRYNTDTIRWQCQDFVDDSEAYDWFKPNFISPNDWHHALKLGWNDDFDDQTNPWNGPVRIIPSSAIWIGCQLSAKSHCYCLLNLKDSIEEVESDVYHFLDLDQDLFKSLPPVTFQATSTEEEKPLTEKLFKGMVTQLERRQALNDGMRDNKFLLKKFKPRRKRLYSRKKVKNKNLKQGNYNKFS